MSLGNRKSYILSFSLLAFLSSSTASAMSTGAPVVPPAPAASDSKEHSATVTIRRSKGSAGGSVVGVNENTNGSTTTASTSPGPGTVPITDSTIYPVAPASDPGVTIDPACTKTRVIKFGADVTSHWGDLTFMSYSYSSLNDKATELSKGVSEYLAISPAPNYSSIPTTSLRLYLASHRSHFGNAHRRSVTNTSYMPGPGDNINLSPFHGWQEYGIAHIDSEFMEIFDGLVPAGVDPQKICDVRIRTRFTSGIGQAYTDGISFYSLPKKPGGFADSPLPSSFNFPVVTPINDPNKVSVALTDILPACFFNYNSNCAGMVYSAAQEAAVKQPYFEFHASHLPQSTPSGLVYTNQFLAGIRANNNFVFYLQDDTSFYGVEATVYYK